MLLLPLLVGCDGTDAGPSSLPVHPTWHADIAPIVQEHCGSCHVEGGIAPFALDTYGVASPLATSMAAAVDAGTMPPWGAWSTDECEPRFGFVDDPRLSEDEKAQLRAWADDGAPEGDPAGAAPLPAPIDLSLAGTNLEVAPAVPYATSGNKDEFRCFVIDPELAEDGWLTGLQVVPGNPEVVHHVLVYADAGRKSAGLAGADGAYDCFGSSKLGLGGALLGAWAPGAFPFEAPEGTGITLQAGTLIVMQVHYHPVGQVAAPDTTTLQLRIADAPPGRVAMLALIGNATSALEGLQEGPDDRGAQAEFRIPSNAPDHVESIHYPTPPLGQLQIFSAGAHMHYVGTDMLIEVEHASPEGDEPRTECLVQTPRWDFDWQRVYAYDTPLDEVPVLRGGDTLRLRCTYDNTLSNPGVRAALEDAGLTEPVDVFLGEETIDEMCLGLFGLVL